MAYFRGEKWARPDQSGSRSEHWKLLQTLETSPPCDMIESLTADLHHQSNPVGSENCRPSLSIHSGPLARAGRAGKSGPYCMFPDLGRRTFPPLYLRRDFFPRARSACSFSSLLYRVCFQSSCVGITWPQCPPHPSVAQLGLPRMRRRLSTCIVLAVTLKLARTTMNGSA